MKLKITASHKGKLSDGFAVPIECGQCGHKFELKLAGHEVDPVVICPACRTKTKIESGGSLRKNFRMSLPSSTVRSVCSTSNRQVVSSASRANAAGSTVR